MKKQTISIVLFLSLLFVNGALIAETNSTAIEEAIYAENTLGNLDRAIQIYEQILNDPQTSPALKTVARSHLKAAYLKKGDSKKSLLLLNKTEKTESADFKKDVQKSKAELASQANSSSDTAELLPVPWENGHTLTFTVFLSHIEGEGIFTVNSADIEGRKYWVFEEVIRNTGLIDGYARVFVEMDSFRPALALMKNEVKSYEIDYRGDEIEITHAQQWWDTTRHLPKVENVYDFLQTSPLVARFPLKPGFEETISFLSPGPGTIHPIRIRAMDKEKVKVPLGRFECFVVTLEYYAYRRWISAGVLWTDTKTKAIVKSVNYINKGAIWELENVSIKPVKITDFNSGAIQPTF